MKPFEFDVDKFVEDNYLGQGGGGWCERRYSKFRAGAVASLYVLIEGLEDEIDELRAELTAMNEANDEIVEASVKAVGLAFIAGLG